MCFTSLAGGAELLMAQPSACAIGDELAFRAERALGQPLSEAGPPRCTIHIVQSRGALAARLEVDSPGQPLRRRSFRASSCTELADTLALAVVLALGAEADASLGDAAGSSEGTASAAVPSGDAHATDRGATDAPASATPGTGSGLHATLAGALVLDAGSLPAAGIGPALAIAIGGDSFEARAIATWLPAREASIDAPSGPGGDIGLVTGGLLACAPQLSGSSLGSRLELGACAGAELGWISGSGVGVNAPSRRGAVWSAARLDLAARYDLGPSGLGMELALSGLLPLERHEFRIVDKSVHRPAPVVTRVSLGLALAFD